MKTIAYNPQREIMTALLTLILSFSILTVVKAQGNAGPLSVSENKTELNEEKVPTLTNTDLAEEEDSENYLEMKIESWIDSGSYWDEDADEDAIVSDLSNDISQWLSSGSFWSPNIDTKTDIDELALANKDETTCDAMENNGN